MTTLAIDFMTLDGTRQGDIALRGLRVTSRLAGLAERTRVEQTFANRGEQPIEPIYTFPLPDGAAVCGFEVITGERVLTGVVDAQERAQKQYEEALERGDGAYLLEHERDDVFTVRVGALRPGQVATLRLDYVRELQVVDRHVRFELPTTLAPRYASQDGMDPLDALLEADAVNPPKAFAVPYGLSFELDVELGRGVRVSSPSHALRTEERDGQRYHVALAGGDVRPDRSVVLDLELAGEDAPKACVETGPDGAKYVAVSFVPELPETTDAEAADLVFVIDCSGSMDGLSIAQAKQALELCLRAMKRGDTFRIVRFGSTHEELTPGRVEYGSGSLERALHDVRRIQADLGGTELRAALEHVFACAPQREGRATQVLVLTDGEVSNEDATIGLAREHAATHRIFTFGIGPAASQSLVHGLARVSGGAAEFVTYGERIEEKVLRTFSRLDAPRVEDVRIEFEGAEVELASSRIPPVFDGDALLVLARLAGGMPESATMRCRVGGEEWCSHVSLPAAGEQGAVPLLWARHRIRELEDRVRGTPAASRFARSRDEQHAETLIELSRRFGVLCSKTAFFAVEHRRPEDRTQGVPELQRVPVQMPVGWHGLREEAPMPPSPVSMTGAFCEDADDEVVAREDAPRKKGRGVFGGRSRGAVAKSALRRGAPVPSVEPEPHADGPSDPLFDLLATQTADGDFGELEGHVPDARRTAWRGLALGLPAGDLGERVQRTLEALAWLECAHGERRAAWQRAARKARAFVCQSTGWSDAELGELLERLVQTGA